MTFPKTIAEVEAHNAKVIPGGLIHRNLAVKPASADFEGRESELHQQIEAELKRRRWYYVHSRTDKKTTQQKGVVDFVIAGPSTANNPATCHPKTYWIEVKRKGGKLSAEQTITRHILQALGHKWAMVTTFDEFLSAIE